jgi:hypothetical protein
MTQELIYLSNVRLSFPHIVEPQQQIASDGSVRLTRNADFITEPDNPGFIAFMQRYAELATETWKENAQGAMQTIQANRKQRCYGAGEEKVDTKTFQVRGGYAGKVYISANRQADKGMPQIVDSSGKPIDPKNTLACQLEARRMYGGCRVNAVIKPWIQKATPKNGGVGIRCDLIALQFAKDDEPFGEAPIDAAPMFAPVAAAPAAPMAPAPQMPAAPFPQVPGMPAFLSGQ